MAALPLGERLQDQDCDEGPVGLVAAPADTPPSAELPPPLEPPEPSPPPELSPPPEPLEAARASLNLSITGAA